MSVYDYSGNKIAELNPFSSSSIVDLNPEINEALLQAKRPLNPKPDGYTEEVQPLVLLWFSDIHGYKTELQRIIELRNHYESMIDDTICTGDMVYRKYADGMTFWDEVDGSDSILMCMGNHDAWKPNASTLATQAEQYSQYFDPYIANWDCTYESGKTYYYKDYSEKNIRLIAINCMLTGSDETAQQTWFASVLASAITEGLSVIVITHYVPPATKVDCGFSSIDYDGWTTGLNEAYPQMIDSFVEGGGEFICWLAGHEHVDQFSHGVNYTTQYAIEIAALGSVYDDPVYSGDSQRTVGSKSQDLANFVAFDTSSKAVKVIRVGVDKDHYLRPRNCMTFKYLTGQILCDY